MRPSVARRMALAAAFALVLTTNACSTSAPAASSTSGASTPSTVSGASAASSGASHLAKAIPTGAHLVAASVYESGTDDYHGTAHPMPGIVQFTTPSGNISCTYLAGADPSVSCSIAAHDFPLPARPATCTLNWAGGLMTLDKRAATLGHCVGGETVTARSRTLAYGDELTSRGISCYSGRAALTCTDRGHGFRLSRTAAHTF